MLCPECGNANREDAAFCLTCRATFASGGAGAAESQSPSQAGWQPPYVDRGYAPQAAYTYAAFWPRAGAWVLDFLFATLFAAAPAIGAATVLGVVVSNSQGAVSVFDKQAQEEQDQQLGLAIGGGFILVYYPVYLAYKTVANSSSRLKEKLGLERTADLIRLSIESPGR